MKFATLPQLIEVLGLIRTKKVPQDQLARLLESGLLADLLDANVDKVDRSEFQMVCGLRRKIAEMIVGVNRPKSQTFDLGDGFVFTVDEVIELEVDDTVEPDELLRRGGHNPSDWEYVGKKPESGTRKVKAAIGRLNRIWTEEQVTGLLTRPNCPVKGSGAWVREAYPKARPRYDGKGWIAFPDPETSRWQLQSDGYVCFPGLWRDGHDWYRSLDHVQGEWNVEDRLCLLCG